MPQDTKALRERREFQGRMAEQVRRAPTAAQVQPEPQDSQAPEVHQAPPVEMDEKANILSLHLRSVSIDAIKHNVQNVPNPLLFNE